MLVFHRILSIRAAILHPIYHPLLNVFLKCHSEALNCKKEITQNQALDLSVLK
jgi:hypothetical protein